MGELGALVDITFILAHRMGRNSYLRISYGTLHVCIGSHAFAMFAHKKITGARGTLTTLYLTWRILLFVALLCIHVWCFPDNFISA
jgi:hypothetical protein